MARVLFGETHRKEFGRISIGDLDKIISYMRLKLHLGVNFNVCVLPNWCDTDAKLDMEAKPPEKHVHTRGQELHFNDTISYQFQM